MMRIPALFFILLCLAPASISIAGTDEVPVFTEQDLEKFVRPEEQTASPRIKTGEDNRVHLDSRDDRGAYEDTKQYFIPYLPYEGDARRIIVPVTLNGIVTARMAFDTGSPGMIISETIARRLGIFEGDEGKLLTMAAGIGGSIPVVLTIIDTVQVGGAEDRFVPTLITQKMSDAFEGLVGLDFMANFSVRIDTASNVMVLERRPSDPITPAGHDESWWRANFRKFASMKDEWNTYRIALAEEKGLTGNSSSLREFAERQSREAEKLFNKLNSYAIEHSVPMSWRVY